jgi:hypothetical protein
VKIPVYVSCPTELNKEQESVRVVIWTELEQLNLEPRTLGRTDYPVRHPLYEVLVMARHCSGGVILGFSQFEARSGTFKKGTSSERNINVPIRFPTPWNNLEAGILYACGLPLLIFREEGITGGVFDPGVTDVFVHKMPLGTISQDERDSLKQILLAWQTDVRMNYYGKYKHPRNLGQ